MALKIGVILFCSNRWLSKIYCDDKGRANKIKSYDQIFIYNFL